MIFTHCDRDEIKRRAEEDFAALVEEHGGRRRGRAYLCPFHDDHSPSATIHKGRFWCFVCGDSWDVFAFIAKARGDDFKGALSFLAARYGVALNDRPMTDLERLDYARAAAAAERESGDLIAWRNGLLEALREARNNALEAYHRSLQYILAHGMDDPMSELAMDTESLCEERYRQMDERIGRLTKTPMFTLLKIYRRTRTEDTWTM